MNCQKFMNIILHMHDYSFVIFTKHNTFHGMHFIKLSQLKEIFATDVGHATCTTHTHFATDFENTIEKEGPHYFFLAE